MPSSSETREEANGPPAQLTITRRELLTQANEILFGLSWIEGSPSPTLSTTLPSITWRQLVNKDPAKTQGNQNADWIETPEFPQRRMVVGS